MMIRSALDLSYMESMSAGDPQTMKTLLEALLKELKSNHLEARKLCEQEDWMALERFCHHYKSTLSFSGDTVLIDANLQIWDIAKTGGANKSKLAKMLSVLEKRSQKVAQEVSRVLKTT